MHNYLFRISIFLIVVLGVLTSLSISAQPVSETKTSEKCRISGHQNAVFNKLATDLSRYTRVFRVQESVVMKLPDQTFFKNDTGSLTYNGNQFVSELADVLSCYPDAFVYIQENTDSAVSSKYRAMNQAFQIQTALIRDGIDVNRLEIDLTTPVEPHQSIKVGDNRLLPEKYFELRIIPRV